MLHSPRFVVGLLVSVIIGTVSLAQTPAPARPVPIESWSPLSPGSLGSILTCKEDIRLSSRAAGVVERIHVADGSPVKKDDPILSLDSQQEAAEVAQCEAGLRGAQADYDRATKEFKRVQDLREGDANIVSPKDFETFVSQEALSKSRRDYALATLELAKVKLNSRIIRSPIDGVFQKTTKAVGEAVERLETIARVVNPSVLQLTLYCDTTFLGRFTTGQTVPIQIQFPQRNNPRVKGTIRFIDQLVDATSSTFRIIIDVPASEDTKAGLPAMMVVADKAPIAKN